MLERSIVECIKSRVVEELPNVVGIRRGRIKLLFRRMLIARHSDTYSIEVLEEGNKLSVEFRGEKSVIVVNIDPKGVVESSYKGPKAWIVRAGLAGIERAVANAYRECLKTVEAPEAGLDLHMSRMLANTGFVSNLIRRSMLLASEEVAVNDGGIQVLLEEIAAEYGSRYQILYVSATGPAMFRALYQQGVLKGIYARIAGEEYYGNDAEKALAGLLGLVRIRIYGSPIQLREVKVLGSASDQEAR